MTTTMPEGLQVKGLRRRELEALSEKAKRLGMTPATYLKHLVEEDLASSRAARIKSFAELMGPSRRVDEDELDHLVERAKKRHHGTAAKRKK